MFKDWGPDDIIILIAVICITLLMLALIISSAIVGHSL